MTKHRNQKLKNDLTRLEPVLNQPMTWNLSYTVPVPIFPFGIEHRYRCIYLMTGKMRSRAYIMK